MDLRVENAEFMHLDLRYRPASGWNSIHFFEGLEQ